MAEIIECNEKEAEEFYIDPRGYMRYKKDGKLIHRDIAFKEVYRKNRDSFPRRFSEYVVHHIDGNKLNNDPSNLSIKPKDTHNLAHEIISRVKKLKNLKQGSKEQEEEINSIEFQKSQLLSKTACDVFF